MTSFAIRLIVLIQLTCLASEQSITMDLSRIKDTHIHDMDGIELFATSCSDFFGAISVPQAKNSTKKERAFRESLLSTLKGGKEHSRGMIVPTSFAVLNDTLFIPSVPTSEIISFTKSGDRIKAYKLQCSESCPPNYFSVLSNGIFLINTWKQSTVREVGRVDGDELSSKRACSLKNWVRENDYIYCEKGLRWLDKQGYFSNAKKMARSLSDFFDYYFLDSSLVVSLSLDDDAEVLMYQSYSSQQSSKPYPITLPINASEYQAVHIVDGNESYIRFLLLSNNFRKDKLIQLGIRDKSALVFQIHIKYDGDPFIGEAAAIWPGGIVYSASNGNLHALLTDKDSIKVYKFPIDALPSHTKDCKP